MKKYFVFAFILSVLAFSCKDDDDTGGANLGTDLRDIEYAPTAYEVVDPVGFPKMEIPEDNHMTEEGIQLGRMLFFDPILSVDSTISCASCHKINSAFSDGMAISPGVNGLMGRRNSMPLINIGYVNAELFWDGRVASLEEQALHPIEDPVEMADVWENVEEKVRSHPSYPALFRKAFGVEFSGEIERDHVTKAIAQFERTLVSANSKWDEWKYKGGSQTPLFFSDKEAEGFVLYFDFDENGNQIGGIATGETAHCSHCHEGPMLGSNRYENNGLDDVETLNDFTDKGRGDVTGKTIDNGTFRAVSLRNIALTAPYMHDGRFQTLKEVVEHYNSGAHYADNITQGSIIPTGLQLDEGQVDALVAFLHTFTDTSYYDNPAFQNPFE